MPNSEAIAWYVEEAQRLLEEQQRRAESLQTRAGQIAGFAALLLVFIGGNATTIIREAHNDRTEVAAMLIAAALCLAVSVAVAITGASRSQSFTAISAHEIATYLTEPFLDAPKLWRVHIRSLRGLLKATEDAQRRADSAVKSITVSLYSLLAGLVFAVGSIAFLTVELI
jgi:uncharacterized protein with GYD domain